MPFFYKLLFAGFLSIVFFISANAQNKNFWAPVNESSINRDLFANRYKPSAYKIFHLNETNFATDVSHAPSEKNVAVSGSAFIISVPNADGQIEKYKIVEAPVMDPSLAARYPDIRSYAGQGIDDPSSLIRFDVSPGGFHAMILSAARKTIYIDPVDRGSNYYIIFSRKDVIDYTKTFHCLTPETINSNIINAAPPATARAADDGRLRTYRLALACTGEYAQYFLDGSETTDVQRRGKVLAAMNTLMTRTNGIYERDFGIRMNLIANNDLIIYLTPSTDPWTNEWNTTTQSTIDAVIGNANYDIGHLVHKEATAADNNGNAGCIACVCVAGQKGSGYTSHVAPEGDPFVVDYTTHEMGHQFGGNHTFTFSNEGGTASQFEPGSGTTIMGYAGITGSTDVQPHSDDYFHTRSIEQISDYIKSGTGGGACAAVTITGNTAPTANAGADYIIPRSTPFILTGSGTDVNGADVLTYTWEQMNAGTSSTTFPSATATTGPLFRSRTASTSPSRTFPILNSVLDGTNGNTWEVLSSVARTLNFRLTVKDNHTGGGNGQTDDMTVTVNGTAGPFAVTLPNTTGITWFAGDFKTVTWNKALTDAAPINCANVSIQLSTDGGNTFPITLAASTPNDGSEEIQVPNNLTAQARIRIISVGNIFFDISNNNFTIANAPSGDFVFNNPAPVTACSGTSIASLLKTGSLASYNTGITLSASGNPGGTTVLFDVNPLTPGNNVTVTLNNIGSLPAGSYSVTINGVSGVINKSRIITFNIGSAAAPGLTTPANNAIGQPSLPTFTWAAVAAVLSYTLEISTNNTFIPVTQTISGITGTSTTLTTVLAENTPYYWRVTGVNGCGAGTPSATRLFKTGLSSCNTIASTDVPKTISSVGTPTITSTITIPGASGVTISDIDVTGLVGTHSYISDLTFSLTSPSSTTVTLFDQICNNENNFNLNLDDEAATGTFPCPPIGNVTIRPQQPLSAFDGQSSTGLWTLTVDDNFDADGGSLTGWGLRICSFTATTLPVNWLSLTAHKEQNNTVTLLWSVNEYDNDHYEIERSADGTTFVKIGELAASNAPGNLHQYIYNDLKPFAGRSYYRIKQVDIDGKSTYSIIVSVLTDKTNTPWVIYPNPARGQTSLLCNDNSRNLQISLLDAAGRMVYMQSKSNTVRGEVITIPLQKIAKGIYTIRIQSDNYPVEFKKILAE
jgi:subtilisin-like proprotein convertase family protein